MKMYPWWHIQEDFMANGRLQEALGRSHEMGHSGSETKEQENHKEQGGPTTARAEPSRWGN